jgi:hypothetical protein
MSHMLMHAPGWLALPALAIVFVVYGVVVDALTRRRHARRPARPVPRRVGRAPARRVPVPARVRVRP